jgi:carbonic anhydrase
MTFLKTAFTAMAITGMMVFTGCKSTGGSCCGSCGSASMELPTTADEQAAATPDAVLAQLMAGNARFVAGERTTIDIENSREAATAGQWPVAYVLSCVDSRVPVEVVFDQGIGDLFVGRVAGNYETGGQLGSMEFATAAAGAKLVMVLGHESCGAIKGSISDVKLGNLTGLLAELKPAVNAVDGSPDANNKAYVDAVIEANVKQTVADLRTRSKVLSDLEKEGKIKIVGGVYSLETGQVTLID